MAAQGGAAALFNGRHDLQLADTEVSPLSIPPRRPVGAEDIRDLRARHESALRRSSWLQWTGHLSQRGRGEVGIERCGLKFFVTE